jgi:hypothetical protein
MEIKNRFRTHIHIIYSHKIALDMGSCCFNGFCTRFPFISTGGKRERESDSETEIKMRTKRMTTSTTENPHNKVMISVWILQSRCTESLEA